MHKKGLAIKPHKLLRFFIGNDEARSGLFFASDTVQLEVLIATCHEGAKSHD